MRLLTANLANGIKAGNRRLARNSPLARELGTLKVVEPSPVPNVDADGGKQLCVKLREGNSRAVLLKILRTDTGQYQQSVPAGKLGAVLSIGAYLMADSFTIDDWILLWYSPPPPSTCV